MNLEKAFSKSLEHYLRYNSETSIYNLLLQITNKANYRDIETFINTDINFKEFSFKFG
jgi:hypothetical protein